MKWRSKATGIVYEVYDSFGNMRHEVSLFLDGENIRNFAPRARLTYAELTEAFEKVEDAEV